MSSIVDPSNEVGHLLALLRYEKKPYDPRSVTDDDPLQPALRPVVYGSERIICCHRAGLSGSYAPNSLEAIQECISAGVPRLEIDVRFTADDVMAVFHDAGLAHETDGTGDLVDLTGAAIGAFHYLSHPSARIALLHEVVDVARGSGTMIQVDLKPLGVLSPARLALLEEALRPLGDGVLVGSQAHWNLRHLRTVPVAFDPTLQWHYAAEGTFSANPRTLGLHGLMDDSPLAHSPFVSAPEYIEARIDDLTGLLPRACEWMVDISTILYMASLGANLGELLGRRGIQLAAWTLHPEVPDPAALLGRLFAAGVTTVITDAPLMAAREAARVGIVAA